MEQSLQERYAPKNSCWGCGPANADGLRIRSFAKNGEFVAEWKPQPKYEAFPGVLNGGIIGTLLDCHCNWTAAYHLMKNAGADHPSCAVTAEYERGMVFFDRDKNSAASRANFSAGT